jgi:hypothetical protein
MGLLDWLERRRTRKSFAQYVSPEIIKLIEQDPSKYIDLGPQKKHFQWILVNLEEASLESIPEQASRIVGACLEHRAFLSGVKSSLILAHLGSMFPDDDSCEKRMNLVNALLAENGDHVRVAHGQCYGLVGNIGTPRYMSWDVIIPNFTATVKNLLNTDFGAAIEVAEASAETPATTQD